MKFELDLYDIIEREGLDGFVKLVREEQEKSGRLLTEAAAAHLLVVQYKAEIEKTRLTSDSRTKEVPE